MVRHGYIWVSGFLIAGIKALSVGEIVRKIKTITNYVYKLVAVDKINNIIKLDIKYTYSKFSEA